jgi:two-component system KDP operon response regulator KdpE
MADKRPTVVAIDDELGMRLLIAAHLAKEGFRVLVAQSGAEGLELIAREQPDLVITDVIMPDMDGFETLRRLRTFSQVPAILLTGRDTYADRIHGLDLGADDYLTKPFSLTELSARIRAILRRARHEPLYHAPRFDLGELSVDAEQRRVWVRGREVRLSPREWSLLLYLCQHAGRPVRFDELLPLIEGPAGTGGTRHLRVWISRLRHKLGDDPAAPRLIRTVPGIGYQIIEDPLQPQSSHTSSAESA